MKDQSQPPGARPEVNQAILLAGQLAGIGFNLEADLLERWLNTNPKDFKYENWCRAAIAFKRALQPSPGSGASRIDLCPGCGVEGHLTHNGDYECQSLDCDVVAFRSRQSH